MSIDSVNKPFNKLAFDCPVTKLALCGENANYAGFVI